MPFHGPEQCDDPDCRICYPDTAVYVSYLRVSTARQSLGVDAQREAVRHFVGKGKLLKEFREKESGKDDNRPQLAAALRFCRMSKSILVVARLDRLSRNVAFLARLMESKVPFVAVDNPHANPLTLHILAALAQHERELISARTKDALAAAKRRGVKLGRPPGDRTVAKYSRQGAIASVKARSHKWEENAQELRDAVKELPEDCKTDWPTLAESLSAIGYRTSRGNPMSVAVIRRALGELR